jgi:putative membrane protein
MSRETMTSPGSRRAAGLALVLALTSGAAVACGSAQATQSPSASSHHVSARDVHWVNQAHQANESEIQAGHYAGTNTGTTAVRSAGAAMVRDHSALDAKLIRVAGKLNISLVQHLTGGQIKTGDQLSQELGSTFNSHFAGTMLAADHQMINATEAEIRHGSSPQVVALARQSLAVLKKELRLLHTAAASA